MSDHSRTLSEIAAALGGELQGNGQLRIRQVAPLERAGEAEIGFVAHAKYRKGLETTQAAALILPRSLADAWSGPRIVVDDPYLYFARVSQLLNPPPAVVRGIHPSAVVLSPVPASASIGALAYVGENCSIAEGVVVGPGCVIEQGVTIGEATWLHSRVVIKSDCVLGRECILHSGVVIGTDGFGIARRKDGSWEKIPQIGRVVIGDCVEIGANTCIDRGALDDTLIGNGVKLDNLIQIGHNCQVGDNTAMAAMSGIAGSTKIGKRVLVGGASGVAGHIEIADDIVLSAHSSVTKSLTEKAVYTSVIPVQPHIEWARNAVQVKHLDAMADRIKQLEKRLNELELKEGEKNE
ncbi:UDP-3-O-(3-hydroxymyristoyl)glucosamine N-acyltransferase [Viridibacterium curvum]|uniref:UDP-3-O-acylglucosamine N-acyltransferase n=1 Tax=Viridibacterium curvum TaxID=1101404 RepID=A0ABP9Q9R6_9RHOO